MLCVCSRPCALLSCSRDIVDAPVDVVVVCCWGSYHLGSAVLRCSVVRGGAHGRTVFVWGGVHRKQTQQLGEVSSDNVSESCIADTTQFELSLCRSRHCHPSFIIMATHFKKKAPATGLHRTNTTYKPPFARGRKVCERSVCVCFVSCPLPVWFELT